VLAGHADPIFAADILLDTIRLPLAQLPHPHAHSQVLTLLAGTHFTTNVQILTPEELRAAQGTQGGGGGGGGARSS
jgi:hypothetical protein